MSRCDSVTLRLLYASERSFGLCLVRSRAEGSDEEAGAAENEKWSRSTNLVVDSDEIHQKMRFRLLTLRPSSLGLFGIKKSRAGGVRRHRPRALPEEGPSRLAARVVADARRDRGPPGGFGGPTADLAGGRIVFQASFLPSTPFPANFDNLSQTF